MAKYITANFTREGKQFMHQHENIIGIFRRNGWFKISDALNVYGRDGFVNPVGHFGS